MKLHLKLMSLAGSLTMAAVLVGCGAGEETTTPEVSTAPPPAAVGEPVAPAAAEATPAPGAEKPAAAPGLEAPKAGEEKPVEAPK